MKGGKSRSGRDEPLHPVHRLQPPVDAGGVVLFHLFGTVLLLVLSHPAPGPAPEGRTPGGGQGADGFGAEEVKPMLWHGLLTMPLRRPKVSFPAESNGDLRSGAVARSGDRATTMFVGFAGPRGSANRGYTFEVAGWR